MAGGKSSSRPNPIGCLTRDGRTSQLGIADALVEFGHAGDLGTGYMRRSAVKQPLRDACVAVSP